MTTDASQPQAAGDRNKNLDELLKLETPVVVRLGERQLPIRDVLKLAPGSIIELPQHAEDELKLYINNKPIGLGHAVKVGENFGLRLEFIGDVRDRLEALGGTSFTEGGDDSDHDSEADAFAQALLSG